MILLLIILNYFPGNGSNLISFGGAGGYPADTFSMSNTGGGQSHENRPPYYALCYIMKTYELTKNPIYAMI